MKPRKPKPWFRRKFTCHLVLLAMLFSMVVMPALAPAYAGAAPEGNQAVSSVVHTVTVDSTITGGSLAVNPDGAAAGEIIIVTVTPDEGKQLTPGSLRFNDGVDDIEITVAEDVYSFILPAADVVVTAKFENLTAVGYNLRSVASVTHSVNKATVPDGIWTVTLDKTVASVGETVTVTVSDTTANAWATGLIITGESGAAYDFTTITAATGNANNVNGPGDYSFVMPDEPVTVDFTADYTKLEVFIRYGAAGEDIPVHSYTRAEMEALAAANGDPIHYAVYDRLPAVFMGKAVRYVTLEQLVADAAAHNGDVRFDGPDCSLRGASLDGWSMGVNGLSWEYLMGAERKYYAGIGDKYLDTVNRTGQDREVPVVLAITGWAGRMTEVDNQPYDTLNAYRFFYGQTEAEYGNGVLPTMAERDARCTAMNTSKWVNNVVFVVPETEPATYTVTADSGITGGAITIDPASGIEGDTITVTATPAEGKQLVAGSLKYTTDNGENYTEITAAGGVYSFTLPAADTIVTARFTDPGAAVNGVNLDKSELTLTVGNFEQLTATVTPVNAALQEVIWASDNAAAVIVSGGGLIRAVGTGTSNVTVTTVDGGFTATCAVTVQPAGEDHFTIAALPDTQFYSESYPEIFAQQTQWLADQAQSQNIVFVAHLGDIQDDYDNPVQWQNAKDAMATIRVAGIPYALVPGNHDLNFKAGDTTQFDTYFPYTDFTGFSWYGGHYPADSNASSYQLFSAMGQDFIVLNLVCTPALLAEATDWANTVLTQHSGRKAIVVTHGYIKPNGEYAGGDDISGIAIRNNIVKKHGNVIAVLCGHINGQYHGADTGDSGNTIYNLLTDYTDQPNGGNGWLRLYQFYPLSNTLQAVTYSPYLDRYDTGAAGQFQLPLEERFAVTADSSISGGTVTVNPAGGREGDIVTVTVAPDEGKQLVAGSLKYNDGTADIEITETGGVYSFVLPAENVTVTAAFGDISSSLTINTREELLAFAAAMNGGDSFEGRTVVLDGNIALDEDGLYTTADEYFQDGSPDYSGAFTVPTVAAAAEIWTPIGTSTNQFRGAFDGGGYTISGLYTNVNASCQGLFGYIGPGGSVKNITVSGVVAGHQYVGGIAGFINGGAIENAANRAVIYASGGAVPGGSGTGKIGHAGGIVGMGTGTASAPVSITGCANYGTVTASNCNQGGRAGGIAGIFDLAGDYATILRCFNAAEIKAYQYAGGIVGGQFADNVIISACYNTGAVTGTSSGKTYAGGITGKSRGPIADCYNTGNIVSTATSGNMPTRFAGIAGETESAGATITNCYTIGQVFHALAIGTSGNIVGNQAVSPVNCYYLDATALGGAGDNSTTTSRTGEELKAPAMPAALGVAFAYDSNGYNNGYPVLAWQNGSIPEPVPHAITLNFDGAAATVSASAAEAAPGETVIITITDLAASKRVQSVNAIDANSVTYPVAMVAENASYTFTMGSSAVTVTVLFENTSAGGDSYAFTVEPGIDPVWTVDVASSGLENDAIAAGSTVTVTVTRMGGAITASLEGIAVRDAGGGTVAAETISTNSGGYNTIGGGVYTFTMPESAVTIGLNAAYAELSVYIQTGENGTPTLVKTYGREDMIALAGDQTIYYTGYDRYPTAVIGKAAQAVRLTDLLDNAGVSFRAGATLKLNALDESTRTYDYAALYGENRYYYPNIAAAENKDAGKTPVDAMLVIKGYQERFIEFEPGQDIDDMVCDTLNAYRFVYGQTETQFNGGIPLIENATAGDFLKYTYAVTIITPETDNAKYTVTPVADEAIYEVGETGGISTMTVKDEVAGLKYFGVRIAPIIGHEGQEAAVFTHLRNGLQLSLNITRADFDLVEEAQAGFNAQGGDTVKVYIVDDLTNEVGSNPTLLQ